VVFCYLDPSDDMFELISGFHWGHKHKNRAAHHSFHGLTHDDELFSTPNGFKEPVVPATTPGNNRHRVRDSLPDRPFSEKSIRYESFKDLKRKRYRLCWMSFCLTRSYFLQSAECWRVC
jgi:hypothetical protein